MLILTIFFVIINPFIYAPLIPTASHIMAVFLRVFLYKMWVSLTTSEMRLYHRWSIFLINHALGGGFLGWTQKRQRHFGVAFFVLILHIFNVRKGLPGSIVFFLT